MQLHKTEEFLKELEIRAVARLQYKTRQASSAEGTSR